MGCHSELEPRCESIRDVFGVYIDVLGEFLEVDIDVIGEALVVDVIGPVDFRDCCCDFAVEVKLVKLSLDDVCCELVDSVIDVMSDVLDESVDDSLHCLIPY